MIATKSTPLHKLLWAFVPYNFLILLIGALDFVQHPTASSLYASFSGATWFRAFCIFVTSLYFVLGYLVLRRSPNNLIGLFMLTYGGGALSHGISIEIAPVLYNVVSAPITLWWAIVIFIPFYFPDGKAYPARLGPVLRLIILLSPVFGFAIQSALPTLPLAGNPMNPWYIPELVDVNKALQVIGALGILPLLPFVFISPYLRYRRADYRQRQQLKWLLLFGGVLVPYLVVFFGALLLYGDARPAWVSTVDNLYLVYIVLFPGLAVGNAILRYKLYDIDIIIRRTLIYSVLTVILAAVYFGSVVVVQQLFRGVIGQSSDLAIVISTLAIYALFSPLRRRTQNIIDRRFYRRKYDADQVIAQFNATLREEVDIETLKANLIDVVQETMQPSHIRLWITTEVTHGRPSPQ